MPDIDMRNPENRRQLLDFLAHGDAEHRAWLQEAIDAFFRGAPRPPVRPKEKTV